MTPIQIFVASLMAILAVLSIVAWLELSKAPSSTKLPYAIWFKSSSGWHEYLPKK